MIDVKLTDEEMSAICTAIRRAETPAALQFAYIVEPWKVIHGTYHDSIVHHFAILRAAYRISRKQAQEITDEMQDRALVLNIPNEDVVTLLIQWQNYGPIFTAALDG